MTTKRHDTQDHALHANPAQDTRDCTGGATSNLPWRQFGWFITATALAGFFLNELWEMAQMSAYVQTAGHPWASTLARCTQAALGDVGIILGIYLTGALVAGSMRWGLRGRSSMFATTAVAGLAYAVLVETLGLAAGRWSYTKSMPVVPVLGVGLWPLLQMTLLPPLIFLLAKCWITCSLGKKAL
jgi:hypothetical protein